MYAVHETSSIKVQKECDISLYPIHETSCVRVIELASQGVTDSSGTMYRL